MSANLYTSTDYDEDSILHSSAKGFSDAATDARAAAKLAAQNVKDGVGWTVYKTAFGLSFGVVFTGVFLTELLPAQNVLRRGLEDGAGAALDAIEARKTPDSLGHDYEDDIARTVSAPTATKPARARRPVRSAKKPEIEPTRRKRPTSR